TFAFNKWKLSLASVAALYFVACQSKKSAGTVLPSFMEPQASLPSAAQPAVMDIRRLWRRLSELIID
ncbi:MAG: hypothetical protein UHO69_07125, partial [Prevotella sp.]|nr:hypothetical protein [Prevotella sp.]